MKTKQILAAFTLSGITMVSQTAFATSIDVTYLGSANFGSGSVGYESGSIAPNPSSANPVGVGIGGDSFTSTNLTYDFSKTGQFNAWCVDIYHWLSGSTTYDVRDGNSLAAELSVLRPGGPVGSTRVSQMIQLADEVYSSVDTKVESAAFQLAIWAISYGTFDAGHYQINTTDQNFRVGNLTASGNLANEWLSALGTKPITANYRLTYLSDAGRENTQDLIVFTVPEPDSIALISLGLAGLVFPRRKKACSWGSIQIGF